jgi:aldehyde dehydrogenase (NAD+)
MDHIEIQNIIERQKQYFESGITLDVNFRLDALKRLKALLINHETDFYEALRADFNKPEFETYASENGLVLQDIGIMIRNLKKWSRPKHVYTSMLHWPARSYFFKEPYGRVLIISPWNYPFQLLFMPLVGALAAGNCVLGKPSRHAKHTFELMSRIISNNFDPDHISIIEGGREVNQLLLEEQFDYVFFTGSTEVGKKVMQSAARHLTPVSLELGGKSPVIVEPEADPRLAAKRILWGKLLNAGQSCVAPDYMFVHEDIKEGLLAGMKDYLQSVYHDDIKGSPDFARIINQANAERLTGYLEGQKILLGGDTDLEERYIEPTIVEVQDMDNILMKEEIFGPILPLIIYRSLDNVINYIKSKPRPLCLYIFGKSRKTQRMIIDRTMSGSGGINETVVHFINTNLPFGGIGLSGMGRYHGKYSFETFSYKRSFLDKANWMDLPLRYPPYKGKQWLIKTFIK